MLVFTVTNKDFLIENCFIITKKELDYFTRKGIGLFILLNFYTFSVIRFWFLD